MKKKYQHYLPKGWTLEDVQAIASYYDNQSEEKRVAEIENADAVDETFVVVPSEIVPEVRKLIAAHQRGRNAKVSKTRRERRTKVA